MGSFSMILVGMMGGSKVVQSALVSSWLSSTNLGVGVEVASGGVTGASRAWARLELDQLTW